ncbi:probable G-protein coupled receptor 25 [Conger conger]|uniref:probable G-protein coupled receptor 25 n=1 Tax=Conger conger TaxID=82655 RepID=UPI002A5A2AA6|nr:probable G-protein coupled receptor 25 [Conger conger]
MYTEPTVQEDSTAFPTMDYYDFNISAYDYLIPLEHCPPTSLPWSNVYLPALYLLVFLAGAVGNVFVVAVVRSKRRGAGRRVDTFIVNLAAADLVFTCTLPLWAVSALLDDRWPFGDLLCRLSSYVITVNRFSNVFLLTCMSADRYLAVVRTLDSRALRTPRCVRLACGAVWALSLALGAPALHYRRAVELDEAGGAFCLEDIESPVLQGLCLVSLLLTFVLPVAVLLFCYGSLLSRLGRRAGAGKAQTEARRRTSLRIVFAIVAAFLLSWLPFNVFKTAVIAVRMRGVLLPCGPEALLTRGLVLSSCLAFFNSCANPAIYLLLDQNFRRRARELCRGCPGALGPRRGRVASPYGTSDTGSGFTSAPGSLFSVTQSD